MSATRAGRSGAAGLRGKSAKDTWQNIHYQTRHPEVLAQRLESLGNQQFMARLAQAKKLNAAASVTVPCLNEVIESFPTMQ
jgi:hypothetical protein